MSASSSAPLPPAMRHRLIAVLRLLGSEHQGERDAAALAADRLVRKHGLDWSELVISAPEPKPEAKDQAPPGSASHDIRDDIAICCRHPGLLNEWERKFLRNVKGLGTLSSKQRAKLAAMALKVRGG